MSNLGVSPIDTKTSQQIRKALKLTLHNQQRKQKGGKGTLEVEEFDLMEAKTNMP